MTVNDSIKEINVLPTMNYHGFYQLRITHEIIKLLKAQEEKPLRCENCRYHREDGWCNKLRQEVQETDYCSLGAWKCAR